MAVTEMPMIGLGTWKSPAEEVVTAVLTALETGYRFIDCAYGYNNEKAVGQGIQQFIEKGNKREDIFLVSKLWNTRHSPCDVEASIRESLELLDTPYLDLYLMHWPHCFKPGKVNFPVDENGQLQYGDTHYMDTWKALEKCVDLGLIKRIGMSNFNSIQIQDVLDNSRIKPYNLQIEIHPYFSQEKLVKFALERGLTVTAYSPLGSPDRPWAKPGDPTLLDEPIMKEIAGKYNKTPAQVILRCLQQRGISVIPKSVTPSRIRENFNIADFSLTDDDMAAIKTLDHGTRLICPMVEKDGKKVMRDGEAPYYPFQENIEF